MDSQPSMLAGVPAGWSHLGNSESSGTAGGESKAGGGRAGDEATQLRARLLRMIVTSEKSRRGRSPDSLPPR